MILGQKIVKNKIKIIKGMYVAQWDVCSIRDVCSSFRDLCRSLRDVCSSFRDVCSSLVGHLAAVTATRVQNPGILPNIVHKMKTPDGERTLLDPGNKEF